MGGGGGGKAFKYFAPENRKHLEYESPQLNFAYSLGCRLLHGVTFRVCLLPYFYPCIWLIPFILCSVELLFSLSLFVASAYLQPALSSQDTVPAACCFACHLHPLGGHQGASDPGAQPDQFVSVPPLGVVLSCFPSSSYRRCRRELSRKIFFMFYWPGFN